jgi:hypothetical protein
VANESTVCTSFFSLAPEYSLQAVVNKNAADSPNARKSLCLMG